MISPTSPSPATTPPPLPPPNSSTLSSHSRRPPITITPTDDNRPMHESPVDGKRWERLDEKRGEKLGDSDSKRAPLFPIAHRIPKPTLALPPPGQTSWDLSDSSNNNQEDQEDQDPRPHPFKSGGGYDTDEMTRDGKDVGGKKKEVRSALKQPGREGIPPAPNSARRVGFELTDNEKQEKVNVASSGSSNVGLIDLVDKSIRPGVPDTQRRALVNVVAELKLYKEQGYFDQINQRVDKFFKTYKKQTQNVKYAIMAVEALAFCYFGYKNFPKTIEKGQYTWKGWTWSSGIAVAALPLAAVYLSSIQFSIYSKAASLAWNATSSIVGFPVRIGKNVIKFLQCNRQTRLEQLNTLWIQGYKYFKNMRDPSVKKSNKKDSSSFDNETDIDNFNKILDLSAKVGKDGLEVPNYEVRIPIHFKLAQAHLLRVPNCSSLEAALQPSPTSPNYNSLTPHLINLAQVVTNADAAIQYSLENLISHKKKIEALAATQQKFYTDHISGIPSLKSIKEALLKLEDINLNHEFRVAINNIPDSSEDPSVLERSALQLQSLMNGLMQETISVFETPAVVKAQIDECNTILHIVQKIKSAYRVKESLTTLIKLITDLNNLQEQEKQSGNDILKFAEKHSEIIGGILKQISDCSQLSELNTLYFQMKLTEPAFLMRATGYEMLFRVIKEAYEPYLDEDQLKGALRHIGILPDKIKNSEAFALAAFRDYVFAKKFAEVKNSGIADKKEAIRIQQRLQFLYRAGWWGAQDYLPEHPGRIAAYNDKASFDLHDFGKDPDVQYLLKREKEVKEAEASANLGKMRVYDGLRSNNNVTLTEMGAKFLKKFGKASDPALHNSLGNWSYGKGKYSSAVEKYQKAEEFYTQALNLALEIEHNPDLKINDFHDEFDENGEVAPEKKAGKKLNEDIKDFRINVRRALCMKKAAQHVQNALKIQSEKKVSDPKVAEKYGNELKAGKGHRYVIAKELEAAISMEKAALNAELAVRVSYAQSHMDQKGYKYRDKGVKPKSDESEGLPSWYLQSMIGEHTEVAEIRRKLRQKAEEINKSPQVRRNNLQWLHKTVAAVYQEQNNHILADAHIREAQQARLSYIQKWDYDTKPEPAKS